MILHGPPSSGKTSLAHIISQMTEAYFVKLNSVSLSIKELRDVISKAHDASKMYGKKTIVFLDEIHAMKSNVQMTLLPAVEDGTITLIGATTESVMHEIIGPLLSRCRVYTFKRLTKQQMTEVILEALHNPVRGLGSSVNMNDDALNYLIDISDGDVRAALGALENVYHSIEHETTITMLMIQEVYENRINTVSTNDQYNLMSAFIKSMRGSNTDAALYWLSRMLYAGIDPMYIARRIVVHSVEDVGMANPHALTMAINAKEAVHFIGDHEGMLPLAQAVVYICESPKSNSVYKAIGQAMNYVKEHPIQEVPDSIKQGSNRYKNPIDYPDVQLNYFEESDKTRFYHPQDSGTEAKIYKRYKNKENN
ncbi:AAA family ATPase [Bacillus carboniphilus]|uniref:AAA family ATPase n=1 Tax=Bacillus carboniphilus TaxID=86663 RepID=A0ABY9K0E8_9BACI|nr:AAA family ATPase [Bacillus carboniphilus]WLR44043.1 AAA family ATPase [Bacillus carboniphilus]